MTFYQKNGENIFAKIFHVGEIFVWSVYSLFFSTRKELDSDLNVGRRGVQGQSYEKISEKARKGPK